jgi:4-amino-4-deoxy-L-arabinose transferase-like glycosyltransferase
LRLAFVLVLLCALGVAGWYLSHSPHGDWDAWAIWNLRARFLYRGGEHWTSAFSPRLPWTHPDYPLLLPGAVSRGWTYAGSETTLVPCLIASLFGAATVGLLMATLALLRGTSQGYLGGLVLLATPYFIELTTAQFADVPLAFFFLASAASFEIRDRGAGDIRLPVLAGALAALAAWTKNEGALFLVVTALVRLRAGIHRRRELAAFALGALPVVLVLAYFKLRLAPVNDLVAGQGTRATWERLVDVRRYGLIAWFYLVAAVSIGPGLVVLLAVYRVLMGGAPNRPRRGHTPAVLVLMLAGYAVVYLTSPNKLAEHLNDSVHRLFMQLWPSALLAFFLAAASPEEARPRPLS